MKRYRLTNDKGEKLILKEIDNTSTLVEVNIEILKYVLLGSGFHTRVKCNKYGRAWKRIRDRYQKQHPKCEICSSVATEVHHIIPIVEGGANHSDENLLSVCHSCHMKIHEGIIEKSKIDYIKAGE